MSNILKKTNFFTQIEKNMIILNYLIEVVTWQ